MVLMAVFAFVPSVAYSVDGNEFLLSPYGITTLGTDGASVTNPLWAYFAVAVFVVLFILLTIVRILSCRSVWHGCRYCWCSALRYRSGCMHRL